MNIFKKCVSLNYGDCEWKDYYGMIYVFQQFQWSLITLYGYLAEKYHASRDF